MSTKFLNSLENSIPLNNSKVVHKYKRFGILRGNSNHCDCEIGVMLESDMTVKEFEDYATNSRSLKAPFTSLGSHYSEIYYTKKQQLFRIYKGETSKIIHDTIGSGYTIKESFEFHLESDEYDYLKDMIKKTTQKENKNYFIITAFDQTYIGYSMKDLRCH